jgi:tRNA threonylcarbamoyladenosine biosynthesis protein TsaB
MKILALDTATEACSVALWDDGKVLARFENAGRSHTERLMPMLHMLMAESGAQFSQLDGITCGIGPGSFAGVRIGVGFVKGLALTRDLPVVGVSSLAMLAQAAIDEGARQVLAAIDARMNEVYFAVYEKNAEGLAQLFAAEMVCAPGAVPAQPQGHWTALGTGWGTYCEVLAKAVAQELASVDGHALPRATEALTLALPTFKSGQGISADGLTPVYLRNKVALTLLEQADLRRRNQR